MHSATRAHAWKRGKSAALVTEWQWMLFPLIIFVYTRMSLLAFSYLGLRLIPNLYDQHGQRALFGPYVAFEGLCRWDCYWFYWIAERGYWEARATNFFPLYPALVRMVYQVTGIPLPFALLIVSNLASFAALLVVYRIFTMLANEGAARWSLALLVAYPFAFFHAAGYPESLMMLYSALAILFALRGQHVWAGVLLGFGVLARHVTLFVGAALVVAQLRERGFHPKRFLRSPAILGLLMPWLFLALYCLYQYIAFGNPLAFLAARGGPPWGELAWWGIGQLLTDPNASRFGDHTLAMQVYIPFALIPTIGAIALLAKKQWLELAAFALILLAVVWTVGIWGLGRYAGSCWPAFLPLGSWLAQRPKLQAPVIALLAVFQGLFFYLFTHQFPIF
jgi:hypothetical protein